MNNKIYGLTKGQYSPTSDRGFVTKSSPFGTVEDPFVPAELTMGARGNFFARILDSDPKNTTEILEAAARHKGTSVTEVLVNCVIYNNGTHKNITDREFRAERTILLRHGEKMIFGANKDKGIILDGFTLRAINLDGSDGYTIDDVLVHDATTKNNALHLMLAMMEDKLPVALGVIRNVETLVYDEEVHKQISEVQQKSKNKTLRDALLAGNVWEVKE